ncbi:hypothetical protein BU26DRAFT_523187 [Trematosphaeria pertusa]|uniref:F-box domain-containing protein n=1 Tax=Trematosphaeria pertusa TaxID=390896 RepID=A0A6A6HZF8_9PLEO|nr:uncharacterized protein BU26DRAFT_523187 [Trematosphaeria pertusa]KAF2243585.1 hypothetical protein BU26DRAFT_523187 [Trematosphaeria pertusa]
MGALDALPNELLSLVANHLDHPRDLVNLALGSRRLSEFAKLDGWKAFLKGRFGILGLDSDARNVVHGLATLYRNWHRKAFVARYLEPAPKATSLNTWERKRWRGPQGQTMGYQPSVDSYEEMFGAWTDRREVLAWSAGTHVVMRVKEMGNKAARVWEEYQELDSAAESGYAFDSFRHLDTWYTYKMPDSVEGRDDITALRALRPHQKRAEEELVFGTASGKLTLLSISSKLQETREQHYNTDRRAVGSVSASSSTEALVAATLGDSSLALYAVDRDYPGDDSMDALSEVTLIAPGMRAGRLWSCKFISDDKIAVGLGPSYEPIQVYEITPSGFLSEPLRKFNLDSKFWGGTISDSSMQRATSVYPILPLLSDSRGGSGATPIFLSGGYDGIVRLHDMRSPCGFETLFWDMTNDSSIYSLTSQGVERFVAGSSMHSMLKVFDLRFPGSHAYHSIPLSAKAPGSRPKRQDYTYKAIVNDAGAALSPISGGWNLFLSPRKQLRHNGYRTAYSRAPRIEDSPVYSLSIPSQTSLNLYAGLEGAVQGLTFASVLDPHPDPLVSLTRFPDTGHVDLKSTYNPHDDVLNVGMYEQGNEEGLGMQLLVQDGIYSGLAKNKARKDFARHRGLDERWKDPSEEGERWSRGQVPQGPTRRGGGRGRGRRGRGRG